MFCLKVNGCQVKYGPMESRIVKPSCCPSSNRNVSQELSETILTMAANCSNVMNKARQPPPGVMPKPGQRAPSTSSLDAISPVQVCVLTFSLWASLGL